MTRKLLSFVVLLGFMNIALSASDHRSETVGLFSEDLRTWFDTAAQASKLEMVEVKEEIDDDFFPGFISRRLLTVRKTPEEIQDILGCLAVEYILRLPHNDVQRQDSDIQSVYKLFGNESILNNKDLSILLGRLCEKEELSDFNLNDSLTIARWIHACEPRIINGLGTDDISSVAKMMRVDEPQLQKNDEKIPFSQSERQKILAYLLCQPHRFLTEATMNGCYDMCNFLIEHGADIHYEVNKATCLYTTIMNDDVSIFALLYNAGLRYARNDEDISRTVRKCRRYAPEIHEYCLEHGIIQKAQQPAVQEAEAQKA